MIVVDDEDIDEDIDDDDDDDDDDGLSASRAVSVDRRGDEPCLCA